MALFDYKTTPAKVPVEDATFFLQHAQKLWDLDIFLFVILVYFVVGLASAAPYPPEQVKLLHRDQTEEWRGMCALNPSCLSTDVKSDPSIRPGCCCSRLLQLISYTHAHTHMHACTCTFSRYSQLPRSFVSYMQYVYPSDCV